ncbi:MAG TPA: hypothetical protein VFW96_13385 [Thermomicrobiales bacterium]|nr:hypothetical protein [Thermomicrobiales bacterium]
MRVILVGLLGLLVFAFLWPWTQFALFGPEGASYSPPPTLTMGYLWWLLDMGLAAVIAAIPTGLLRRTMWRLMTG